MRFLITGAKGQLGGEFVRVLEERDEKYISFGKEDLDVRDFSKVLEILRLYKPRIVINCSAYNQVDRAEDEFEQALAVNSIGVSNLAIACREIGSFLVHYSTDYVFDGEKEGLYTEDDSPNPLSKYALSKYLGEKQISAIMDSYLIFRTSWVYGEGKQNFLYKLSQWAQNQDYLRIACDEFSVPTSTRIIVEVTLKALDNGLSGLYHLVCSGFASRYEWAKEYLRIKGIKKFIYPASQAEFGLPAKRPRFSAMNNEKLTKALNISIPAWDEELKRFFGGKR